CRSSPSPHWPTSWSIFPARTRARSQSTPPGWRLTATDSESDHLEPATLAVVAAAGSHVSAQTSAREVYTCTDDKGQRRVSERLIAECSDREQRVLNRDGSLKRVVPPTLTADERAEREAAERKASEERSALADAVRRDRNLKARFPNETAHNRAREGSL